ncbi:fumarylacetoacetate hydrolase family protein [Streptomyces sp. 6N223]|uniref:fumarylacetoacetate hydrolase family protein n=1 Tax=Streptomyces sp. 6N223 TaxID=3457412 RepID=UPI003FD4DB7E
MNAMNAATATLPEDTDRATLVGRLHDPADGGPSVVALRDGADGELIDLTPFAPTVAHLLDHENPIALARSAAPIPRAWPAAEVLAATLEGRRDVPHLLAPCDVQVIKACGVTFVRSLIERVIEEAAMGDPARAADVRERVQEVIGGALADLVPGSAEAARAKQALIAEGLWSQYLEVGIGPDAEVFTKAPVLSAVGTGAPVGVWSRSAWNNPEPELVLAVNAEGRPVGATLGNDVNLRDIEGRSALLLGKAKDNNASCAMGPFLRLFDEGFGMDDVRALDISLTVDRPGHGPVLSGVSSMREISRDPLELLAQTTGAHHQYPDGLVLFTGTLFAPGDFTHALGDEVRISSPRLGTLVNAVSHAESAPPWSFGIRALMTNLARRGLLR